MSGEATVTRATPVLKLRPVGPHEASAQLVKAVVQPGQDTGMPVRVSPTQNFAGPALWIKTDAMGNVVDLMLVGADEPAQE